MGWLHSGAAKSAWKVRTEPPTHSTNSITTRFPATSPLAPLLSPAFAQCPHASTFSYHHSPLTTLSHHSPLPCRSLPSPPPPLQPPPCRDHLARGGLPPPPVPPHVVRCEFAAFATTASSPSSVPPPLPCPSPPPLQASPPPPHPPRPPPTLPLPRPPREQLQASPPPPPISRRRLTPQPCLSPPLQSPRPSSHVDIGRQRHTPALHQPYINLATESKMNVINQATSYIYV